MIVLNLLPILAAPSALVFAHTLLPGFFVWYGSFVFMLGGLILLRVADQKSGRQGALRASKRTYE
jgi:hypothetical protein